MELINRDREVPSEEEAMGLKESFHVTPKGAHTVGDSEEEPAGALYLLSHEATGPSQQPLCILSRSMEGPS